MWSAVLREYARTQIEGTSQFPVNGQKPQTDDNLQESQETASSETEETPEDEPETQVSRVLTSGGNTSQTGPGVKAD